jgi:hypothetical protein
VFTRYMLAEYMLTDGGAALRPLSATRQLINAAASKKTQLLRGMKDYRPGRRQVQVVRDR